MNTVENIDKILTSNVIEEIKKRIIKHHELYDSKISSVLWEEILHKSFLKNNMNSKWSMYGHQSGTDIECDGKLISCKSGTIKGKKIKKLCISSYRTTSLKTIEEKLEFLDKCHEDVILSLVHDGTNYKIYAFTQPKVSGLVWLETKGQWKAHDKTLWNEFRITKSMSDQFWMNLSIDNWHHWGIKTYDL